MTRIDAEIRESDVERVRELASIGAGHAATALSRLLDRPFLMRVPRARLLSAENPTAPLTSRAGREADGEVLGVFFEIEGGLGGVLALLVSRAVCRDVVEQLSGRSAKDVPPEEAESMLRELSNIVASHFVSALSDTLGVAVLPSVPMLTPRDAEGAFASMLALRESGEPILRVETELVDRSGDLRATLVFVPDEVDAIAGPGAF